MPRVYSYIRFSDSRQAAGASSDRQRDFARAWAAEHGLQLDESLTLRDEGLSAYHQRHVTKGALGAFLRAIEAGQVEPESVLLVESLDRLSRAEPLTALAQLTGIIDAGVAVVTASDRKVYTRASLKAQPMDLMHSLLVMIRAHEESETKSRRVRDAIRRQCLGWQAGTYRGLVRYGKTPGWLRVVGGRWEAIPERAAALQQAVDLWRAGQGLGSIARALHAAGLQTSDAAPTSSHLSRLLTHPAIVGDKVVQLDGEAHTLADYYPAIVSREVYAELLDLARMRGRRTVRGTIPPLFTGLGIAHCGYCGGALKAQTMTTRRRPDGSLPDSMRRLQCTRVNAGERCAVPGSCSVAPVEAALVRYCSDLLNLRALYRGDQAAAPKAAVAAAQARLDTIDAQLARLTDAMLASDAPPASFLRRAQALELERTGAAAALAEAERLLSDAARADLTGLDERWRSLADGIAALDADARMQARQLVADTFARIVVWHHGQDPASTPRGMVDLLLVAKGGIGRLLRVSATGDLIVSDEVDESDA